MWSLQQWQYKFPTKPGKLYGWLSTMMPETFRESANKVQFSIPFMLMHRHKFANWITCLHALATFRIWFTRITSPQRHKRMITNKRGTAKWALQHPFTIIPIYQYFTSTYISCQSKVLAERWVRNWEINERINQTLSLRDTLRLIDIIHTPLGIKITKGEDVLRMFSCPWI